MKPITQSRNEREGRYAGRRTRSYIELNRYNWIRVPGTRHCRTGPFRVNPHAHYCDSWSCA